MIEEVNFMTTVSIIPPVYNVENYLDKFIESIINQSFSDWELILVDDGSTDKSGIIADDYATKDSRIKVIHKANGGAPSARNTGIEVAKGKYVYFPDPDDWLDPDYLERIVYDAEKSKAQLVISGFTMEYYEKGRNYTFREMPKKIFYSSQKKVRKNIHNYFNNMMVAVPWNKLYLTDYIKKNNLKFPDIKWDDLHFNLEVIKNIDSVLISDATGYHFFRSRPGSETTKVFDESLYKRRKEQFSHILKIYNYWEIKDPEIMKKIYGYYAGRIIQCVTELSGEKNKKIIKKILMDNLTIDSFKLGEIESLPLRIIAFPIKNQNIRMSMFAGKSLSLVKANFPGVFYYMKNKSVNNANPERKIH